MWGVASGLEVKTGVYRNTQHPIHSSSSPPSRSLRSGAPWPSTDSAACAWASAEGGGPNHASRTGRRSAVDVEVGVEPPVEGRADEAGGRPQRQRPCAQVGERVRPLRSRPGADRHRELRHRLVEVGRLEEHVGAQRAVRRARQQQRERLVEGAEGRVDRPPLLVVRARARHPQRDRVADRAQLEQAEVGERDRGDREEDGEERLPRDRRAEALVRAREHVVHRRGEGEVGLEHAQFLGALLAQFFDASLADSRSTLAGEVVLEEERPKSSCRGIW